MSLKMAGGAEVFVLAELVYIGPEALGVRGNGIAWKIGAALGDRRSVAEIEAEESRRDFSLGEQPLEHLRPRPGGSLRHECRRSRADLAERDGYSLVPAALGT